MPAKGTPDSAAVYTKTMFRLQFPPWLSVCSTESNEKERTDFSFGHETFQNAFAFLVSFCIQEDLKDIRDMFPNY
jgi:hypothetical protein